MQPDPSGSRVLPEIVWLNPLPPSEIEESVTDKIQSEVETSAIISVSPDPEVENDNSVTDIASVNLIEDPIAV